MLSPIVRSRTQAGFGFNIEAIEVSPSHITVKVALCISGPESQMLVGDCYGPT